MNKYGNNNEIFIKNISNYLVNSHLNVILHG
jgi:hypothetical protein